MGKKHNKPVVENASVEAAGMHSAEYKVIKHDLIKLVLLNILYLGLVLTLYFTNQQSRYLERWFQNWVKF